MEVTTSLLRSPLYVPISRTGSQGCEGTLPCCKAPGLHGAPVRGQPLTFLCLIAVNPNVALRADAEEGGLINPGQAGAPILTVVHVAEVSWKQSHMSLRATPKAGVHQSPADAHGGIPAQQQELLQLWMLQGREHPERLLGPTQNLWHSKVMRRSTTEWPGPVLPWHITKWV